MIRNAGFWAAFTSALLCAIYVVSNRNVTTSLEYLDNYASTSQGARLLAEENSMKFNTEDKIAKSDVSRQKPIDEVLGDLSSPNFERREVCIRC